MEYYSKTFCGVIILLYLVMAKCVISRLKPSTMTVVWLGTILPPLGIFVFSILLGFVFFRNQIGIICGSNIIPYILSMVLIWFYLRKKYLLKDNAPKFNSLFFALLIAGLLRLGMVAYTDYLNKDLEMMLDKFVK